MANTALVVAGMLFLLVSIFHVARLLFKVRVTIADFVLPLWTSAAGALVALFLAVWMFAAVR
jgi:hypothetical protein